MKIIFDNNDVKKYLDEYTYEDELINDEYLRDKLIGEVVDTAATNLCSDNRYDFTTTIKEQARELINNNKDKIIERVVAEVSQQVMMKKAIMSEMPRKSEIAGINKEWEKYFSELIDKAIAKKFK